MVALISDGSTLDARSGEHSKVVMITFYRIAGSPTITIYLFGCENILPKLQEEIHDVIGGMRPWYDVLSRFPIGYSLGIAVLVALIGIFWVNGYILGIIGTFGDENREHIFRLILCVFIVSIWFPVYKLLVFVFPPTVFAIGQGEARFNRMKWFHNIIAAFVISLIASLIVLIFSL